MSDVDEPPIEVTSLHAAPRFPVLRSEPVVTWTDMAGEHTTAISGRVIVGSAPGSGIIVQEPTVSRLHAELDPRPDGLWIRDLGSRNGTFVEGLQVSGARVPPGGKIRLGAVELVVDASPAATKAVELWPGRSFHGLVGGGVAMRELFARLARVAPGDASVLIQGETGTGKELVARALHDASPRSTKPFVVVDCAALPETLLDAELFGHTKGAFTGAAAARPGAIESAHGGTVFLDEIGELPMLMQPKLLRVLESRAIRRVGEANYRSVDVRFVSATHRDLLTMVSAGEFREDLYFRLAVLPITVPALRDRKEDIELLVAHFLGASRGSNAVSTELVNELTSRPWRGNVRELRNFIERARALGPTEALAMTLPASPSSTSHVPVAPAFSASDVDAHARASGTGTFEQCYRNFREQWVDAGEREYVRRLLLRHRGNVSAAAREAEIDRTHVYRLIRKHAL